ncbi:hypothetical protein C8F04DRAFT_1187951 [Mycena alexandri]|uniref:Uncharacterized protein n=1 Tax=Mycena alexandri TaxID=1745969 RepID=A0AAD6WVQ7_9AGAR|nr:hypothetical protein C8F04DRAFT_1187951 [Mycena alexandri]
MASRSLLGFLPLDRTIPPQAEDFPSGTIQTQDFAHPTNVGPSTNAGGSGSATNHDVDDSDSSANAVADSSEHSESEAHSGFVRHFNELKKNTILQATVCAIVAADYGAQALAGRVVRSELEETYLKYLEGVMDYAREFRAARKTGDRPSWQRGSDGKYRVIKTPTWKILAVFSGKLNEGIEYHIDASGVNELSKFDRLQKANVQCTTRASFEPLGKEVMVKIKSSVQKKNGPRQHRGYAEIFEHRGGRDEVAMELRVLEFIRFDHEGINLVRDDPGAYRDFRTSQGVRRDVVQAPLRPTMRLRRHLAQTHLAQQWLCAPVTLSAFAPPSCATRQLDVCANILRRRHPPIRLRHRLAQAVTEFKSRGGEDEAK